MVPETTDITLFVRTSNQEIAGWNRRRIVDALIRETNIDLETADNISREVEKQIVSSGISILTTPLIRELVDAKLIERGLEQARRLHSRLGFPLYDARALILHRNKENANVPHGPEGTNLILAEGIKREYALYDVFSQDIGDAHAGGDIHLHGLGFVDRPYSAFLSLEYLKKFGINMPHAITVAKPAKHAEVLIAHMVRFGAAMQAHFAGVIGWDIVNISFAPYLKDLTDQQVRQVAQMLIYEFSQLTSARGGQAMFTDIHLYWDAPDWLINCPAIGPGGKPTDMTYGDCMPDARRFALALCNVFLKGDGTGKPFVFPRPIIHITDKFLESGEHKSFLSLACKVAADKGNPSFCFHRQDMPLSFYCGTPSTDEEFLKDIQPPWNMRRFVMHNVTVNLPRLGYRAKGDDSRLLSLLTDTMELCARAHVQKKDFLEKLLADGLHGPLALLTMNRDGFPYFRMDRTVCLIGMIGLNELVWIHKGSRLHESPESISFGKQVVNHMREQTLRLSEKYGIRLALGQSHAETTAHRFARLDLKFFSPEAGRFVRGNIARGEIYYTNSTHLEVSASTNSLQRIAWEGSYHHLIEGGAATNIGLGTTLPTAEQIAALVIKAFHDTESSQITFSPEFTICDNCGCTSRGLKTKCDFCGSDEVDGLARITQYFSRVSDWNKGKIAELRDKNRNEVFT